MKDPAQDNKAANDWLVVDSGGRSRDFPHTQFTIELDRARYQARA